MYNFISKFLFMTLLCITPYTSYAVVSGTVSYTDGEPVKGALISFTDESNPEQHFSTYTNVSGYYEMDTTTSVDENLPISFSLGQNYPNPFNPTTTIPFSLDSASHVSITIYNIMGQKIATIIDNYIRAGSHTVIWGGTDDHGNHVSAGIYLYQLKAGRYAETKKMLLLDGGGSGIGVSYAVKSAFNSSMQDATKITDGTTYTVTIIHDSIIPYEEMDVTVVDGQTLNFVVSLIDIEDITFVSIPGDTFLMGSDFKNSPQNPLKGDTFEDEQPIHEITLSSFEMSIYEITNAQYAAYLNAAMSSGDITIDTLNNEVIGTSGSYSGEQYFYFDHGSWRSEINYRDNTFSVETGKENYPVYDETWYGAKSFALYYGFDLPTEAEWEYACRAGTETYFYTGNNMSDDGRTSEDLDRAGWYHYNSDTGVDIPLPYTRRVGQKEKNVFNLYDMHGNVYEWCNDWYGEDYYASSQSIYPTGPDTGSDRVVRGGCWDDSAMYCRSADRKYSHRLSGSSPSVSV